MARRRNLVSLRITSEFPFDFYVVGDFECFLKPPSIDPEPSQQQIVSTHMPSGFCVYRVSAHQEFQTPPFTYWDVGENVMRVFFDHVFAEVHAMGQILARNVFMTPLSVGEQAEHDRATVCRNCKEEF